MERITTEEDLVFHNKYFYFDFNGNSYRGCWEDSGYSFCKLVIWEKQDWKFIFNFTTWKMVVEDAFKISKIFYQDKKEYYNAIKTHNICIDALVHISKPRKKHTNKIILTKEELRNDKLNQLGI